MGLSIKDPRAEAAVRKLAEMADISLTEAVRIAVENEISRKRKELPLVERLRGIAERLDARSEPTGLEADKAFFDTQGGE